jgi:hypothetical protein
MNHDNPIYERAPKKIKKNPDIPHEVVYIIRINTVRHRSWNYFNIFEVFKKKLDGNDVFDNFRKFKEF